MRQKIPSPPGGNQGTCPSRSLAQIVIEIRKLIYQTLIPKILRDSK
jgi:hypothetical protein